MAKTLAQRLKDSREKRGWTIYEACRRMDFQVKHESLSRLEEGRTDPLKVPVRSMAALVNVYWPEIQLEHFFAEDPVRYKLRFHPTRGWRKVA